MYYVYVLKSKRTGMLYIGYTTNLRLRVQQHNQGESTSTKFGKPWILVYYESYLSAKDARKRELQLKQHKSAYGFLKRRITDSLSRA